MVAVPETGTLLTRAKVLAEEILDALDAWDRDLDLPVCMRQHLPHPGHLALQLARLVRHIPDEDA